MTDHASNAPADGAQPPRNWGKIIRRVVRVTILSLVAWGIWRTIRKAGADLPQRGVAWRDIDLAWSVLAGLFYIGGLMPCWLFWQRTLQAMGQRPHWRETLRAFWIGHLGKYVPGKAMVVVLRTGLVASPRVSKTVAATSVFVETLTMMAMGAFVSAVILLFVSDNIWLMLLAVGLMVGSGVPTLPPIFRRVVRMLKVNKANPDVDAAVAGVKYPLMITGWVTVGAGWFLLGMSLWATLRALPDADAALADIPLLTATTGLAMVAGFLSLIPGGLGVRDYILIVLLAPRYDEATAIVSAVLLRVIWLLSELLVSAILYVDVWRARRAELADASPTHRRQP